MPSGTQVRVVLAWRSRCITYPYGTKASSIAQTRPLLPACLLLAAAAIAHRQGYWKAMLQEESSEVLGKRFHFYGPAVGCFKIPGQEPFSSTTRLSR